VKCQLSDGERMHERVFLTTGHHVGAGMGGSLRKQRRIAIIH
jgi:hypothetical protein